MRLDHLLSKENGASVKEMQYKQKESHGFESDGFKTIGCLILREHLSKRSLKIAQ